MALTPKLFVYTFPMVTREDADTEDLQISEFTGVGQLVRSMDTTGIAETFKHVCIP